MLSTKVLIAVAFFAPAVLADGNYCTFWPGDSRWEHLKRHQCQWFGEAPGCGTSDSSLGDIDGKGRTLVAWTKNQDKSDLCKITNPDSPGLHCCGQYGSGCWSGYKRLWCDPNPPTDETDDATKEL